MTTNPAETAIVAAGPAEPPSAEQNSIVPFVMADGPGLALRETEGDGTVNLEDDLWLEKALEVLEAEGVNAVKIDRLAKLLETSRSGFYWHFKDRQDLLSCLLHWAMIALDGIFGRDRDGEGNFQSQTKTDPA